MQTYKPILMESVNPSAHTLYIIGNGFDLMHRVPSSYYNFRDSLGKNNSLRYSLETALTAEDIWADFENALGTLNLNLMGSRNIIDMWLDDFGVYGDEDSGAAEFYMAVEAAAAPMANLVNNLQPTFRRWIECLEIGTDDRPLNGLIHPQGKVLDFNYTEFIETLYGVKEVCYIHGSRKKKKKLILGHKPGAAGNFHQKNRKPQNYRQAMIDIAQDNVFDLIGQYDKGLTKDSQEIIKNNQAFFNGLACTEQIVVIGHSISLVDWDYFIEVNKKASNAHWYFGIYGLNDLRNMAELVKSLNIKNYDIFRTDSIWTKPKVEIHTESVLPRALPTVAERKRQALELLARWGEQNTNRALAILATGGDTAEAEKLLAVQSDYIRRRFDCSDFYLVYYPYILRTFGKRGSGILSEKTENELTDCLLGFRYWIDEPGNDAMWFWSENHALMFHTCQLLAGELFPDEVFTNSGLTGRQMQAKAKNMLYDWFVTFRKEGFTEWNSSPYLPIDTLGFGSLYAFAQDPAMRELGREGMDFAYYLLAVHSQQGIFASSSGRTYIKEQFGNWSNCPSGLSWIGYGYGVPGHAGKGITSYCLSDYEPPKEFAQWFSIPRGKEMICQTTQGNDGYVDLYTYKTADYMMTSANDFHPGEPGHQENPFQLTFNAVAQLWVTHPGERVLFGAARPSYWAGNGTLPKVNQYKAFAGLIYDIAPEHPVDFTHLYLPSMEFDRCEVEGKWAFVQLGSAYAAVYCSNGMRMQDFGSNKDRECIAEGRRCIWLVRAAQADEFAAFEDFKAAMREAALDADAEGRRYRFVDPVYGELRCQWGETLYVNDAPMQYSGFDNYGKLTMQEK